MLTYMLSSAPNHWGCTSTSREPQCQSSRDLPEVVRRTGQVVPVKRILWAVCWPRPASSFGCVNAHTGTMKPEKEGVFIKKLDWTLQKGPTILRPKSISNPRAGALWRPLPSGRVARDFPPWRHLPRGGLGRFPAERHGHLCFRTTLETVFFRFDIIA